MPESNVPSAPATPPVATTKAPVAANTEVKGTTQPPVAKVPATAEDLWDVQENGQTLKKSRKEIIEAYQLRQLSDKKRSEADKVLQEYNRVFEQYKKDPIKFMKATGVDFDNLATSYLSRKAEDAMMDPKELAARQQAAELETYKKYVAEQKEAQEKAAKESSISQERSRIHKEIIEAIEANKELGVPVDEELVIAIAQKMILQDKKQKPLNAKEALPQAYASTQKWLQGMASKMEGEAIVKWLGDDVARKIRKYDLAQLKAKRKIPQTNSSVKPQAASKDPKAVPYKTWSQFKADTLDKIQ